MFGYPMAMEHLVFYLSLTLRVIRLTIMTLSLKQETLMEMAKPI